MNQATNLPPPSSSSLWHQPPKTMCRNWQATGQCRWGIRCRYLHTNDKNQRISHRIAEYKQATDEFTTWLAGVAQPLVSDVQLDMTQMAHFERAIQTIFLREIQVPLWVVAKVQVAIELRTKVHMALHKQNKADIQHHYFLQVLINFWESCTGLQRPTSWPRAEEILYKKPSDELDSSSTLDVSGGSSNKEGPR